MRNILSLTSRVLLLLEICRQTVQPQTSKPPVLLVKSKVRRYSELIYINIITTECINLNGKCHSPLEIFPTFNFQP